METGLYTARNNTDLMQVVDCTGLNVCHQVAASLWLHKIQTVKFRRDATSYLQTCCKLLGREKKLLPINLQQACCQLAANLSSPLKAEDAMRTHPDTGLINAQQQICSGRAPFLKADFHFRVFHTRVYARKTLTRLKH